MASIAFVFVCFAASLPSAEWYKVPPWLKESLESAEGRSSCKLNACEPRKHEERLRSMKRSVNLHDNYTSRLGLTNTSTEVAQLLGVNEKTIRSDTILMDEEYRDTALEWV